MMRPTPVHVSNSLRAAPEEWDEPARPSVTVLRRPPRPNWRNSPGEAPAPQAVLSRVCPAVPGAYGGVTYAS